MPLWLDLTLMVSTVAGGVWLLVRAVLRHSRCEACPAYPRVTAGVSQRSVPRRKSLTQLGIGRSASGSAARAAASAASRDAPSS